MEASALRAPSAPAALPRPRLSTPGLPLRLRSDDQLVALFRAGNEDAFRTIYERYRARLFAYTRQMLPGSRQDAEDALQDVFIRAYRHLRSSERDVALRPWLYRVAHNRCIDVLRRPVPPSAELLEVVAAPRSDPLSEAEQREDLRKLVADVRRLPDHQRSALLMRELEGCAYGEIAEALDVTVPAVKSLLVRARIGLAQAVEARDTNCVEIREALAAARERGVRSTGQARRHLRDCAGCRAYKAELRSIERRLAALTPGLAPVALLAKLLGGGASSGAGAAAAGGGSAAAGAGAAGSTLVVAAATKAVVVVAVAAVAAGGAVGVEHELHPSKPRPAVAAPRVAPPTPAVARPAPAPMVRPAAPVPYRSAVASPAAAPVRRTPVTPPKTSEPVPLATPPPVTTPDATPAVPTTGDTPVTGSTPTDGTTPPATTASPDPATPAQPDPAAGPVATSAAQNPSTPPGSDPGSPGGNPPPTK